MAGDHSKCSGALEEVRSWHGLLRKEGDQAGTVPIQSFHIRGWRIGRSSRVSRRNEPARKDVAVSTIAQQSRMEAGTAERAIESLFRRSQLLDPT